MVQGQVAGLLLAACALSCALMAAHACCGLARQLQLAAACSAAPHPCSARMRCRRWLRRAGPARPPPRAAPCAVRRGQSPCEGDQPRRQAWQHSGAADGPEPRALPPAAGGRDSNSTPALRCPLSPTLLRLPRGHRSAPLPSPWHLNGRAPLCHPDQLAPAAGLAGPAHLMRCRTCCTSPRCCERSRMGLTSRSK